jgi:subtilisin
LRILSSLATSGTFNQSENLTASIFSYPSDFTLVGAMKMSGSAIEDTLAAIGYVKVIATLKEPAPATAASAVQVEASIQNHFMVPDVAQAQGLAAMAMRSTGHKIKRPEDLTSRRVRVYHHLGLVVGNVNASGLASLQSDPKVGKIDKAPELSLIRPVDAQPSRLGTGPTWGIKRIRADSLWAAGFTGKDVIVGHLDTGIDGTHPALAGAIAKFAQFDMAGDRVPGAAATDSDEHGTHTAGTIVGRRVSKGQFGVAPEAKLASAMVIEGGQVIDRILAGMDWVIGEGVRIMSMSLGLRGFTPAFQSVIDALRAANVLPVIAVGNEGPTTSRSPGNYANVLSVGAMNVDNQVADFSGSQRFDRPVNPLCPALVAPGVDVLSGVPGGRYKTMDGSSMATPHIAGLAALLLQAQPSATADQLEAAIVGSCSLPSGMPQPRGNHGVPDAVRAFELLTGRQLQTDAAALVAQRRSVSKPRTRRKAPRSRPHPRAPKRTTGRPKVAASHRSTRKKAVKRRSR